MNRFQFLITLTASLQAYLRRHRQFLVALVAMLAAGLAIYAFFQWGRTEQLTFDPKRSIDAANVDRMWFSRTGNLVIVGNNSPQESRVTVVDGVSPRTRSLQAPAHLLTVDDSGLRSDYVWRIKGHPHPEIASITFNANGGLLAFFMGEPPYVAPLTGDASRTLQVTWPAFKLSETINPYPFVHEGKLIAFLALDQRYIAVFDATVWPGPTNEFTWNSDVGTAMAAALSVDGAVAVGTGDGSVIILEKSGDATIVSPGTAPGRVRALAFLDRDNVIVTGDFEGVKVVTRRGGKPTPPIETPNPASHALRIAVGRGTIAYTTATGVAIADLRSTERVTPIGWIILSVAALVLLMGVVAVVLMSGTAPAPVEPVAEPDKLVPEPTKEVTPEFAVADPPRDLIAAMRDDECILYAGPDVIAEANVPGPQKIARQLLREAKRRNVMSERTLNALGQQIDSGSDIDGVIDAAMAALSATRVPVLQLLPQFKRHRQTRLLTLVSRLRVAGVLTPNLDDAIERALSVEPCFANEAERVLETMHSRRRRFVLKLQGSISRPDTLNVSRSEFAAELARNVTFAEVLNSLFMSRTFLFIGTTLDAIERFVVAIRGTSSSRSHFALVRVSDESWRARAAVLQGRFGITTLPYSDRESIATFLEMLSDRTAPERSSKTAIAATRPPLIKKVELINIGPFERQEISFDPKWTVLLGDNGVGKSNILRAVGVALAGKDAKPYAGRMVRAGTTYGSITLHTERDVYVVEIRKRTDGPPDVSAGGARPFEAEGFPALGFPALRTVTWTRRTTSSELRPRPVVDDVLPIVRAEPDPRVDELKGWILEQRTRSLQEQERGATKDNRYERLLERFFDVINQVTPGLHIRLVSVDVATKEVLIETDDGPVPIESVSQGTISLMGWIGVMLQRMFEIHGDSPGDPLNQYAFVLIDEIDAHMHPGWQKRLAPILSEIFKNAQFVASTHSPLIVSELKSEQVLVLGRREGTRGVIVERPPFDVSALRADQLLTSLFGLPYTRGSIVERDVKRYSELLVMTSREKKDEEEFQVLRQKLESQVTAEDPIERGVERIVRETVVMLRESRKPKPLIETDDIPADVAEEIKSKLSELLGVGDQNK